MKKTKLFIILSACCVLLGASSCSEDVIIKDSPAFPMRSMSAPLGTKTVKITTEPEGAKIMLISMGNRKMQTFYAPAEISYMVTPAMPTVVTIAKKGYKSKNVRLDGSKNELHVILEKAPIMPMYDFGGMSGGMSGAGPSGIGGGAPADIPGAGGTAPPMDSGTIAPKPQ